MIFLGAKFSHFAKKKICHKFPVLKNLPKIVKIAYNIMG
jgi:hypothetical protein